MIPFDDSIDEEIGPQNEELVARLRQLYARSVSLAPEEQEQAVARVQERLLHTDVKEARKVQRSLLYRMLFAEQVRGTADEDDAHPLHQDMAVQEARTVNATASVRVADRPSVAGHKRRSPRFLSAFNTLAAALVVGMITVAALLLFGHHAPSSTALGPTGVPVRVFAERGGLEASMQLTAGPYFLSEVLAVNLWLTNHTHTIFPLHGSIAPTNMCGTALNILTTGGGAPHYSLPPPGSSVGVIVTSGYAVGTPGSQQHFGPGGFFPTSCLTTVTSLNPGQTIQLRQYIAITNSGRVTLTGEALFDMTKVDARGNPSTTHVASPLDGHWPSVSIDVSSQVPQDRMLSFRLEGSQVTVNAPSWALSHLLYLYSVRCQSSSGGMDTTSDWEPIVASKVTEPACPIPDMTVVQWTFAFSAPGYAIVSGKSW